MDETVRIIRPGIDGSNRNRPALSVMTASAPVSLTVAFGTGLAPPCSITRPDTTTACAPTATGTTAIPVTQTRAERDTQDAKRRTPTPFGRGRSRRVYAC